MWYSYLLSSELWHWYKKLTILIDKHCLKKRRCDSIEKPFEFFRDIEKIDWAYIENFIMMHPNLLLMIEKTLCLTFRQRKREIAKFKRALIIAEKNLLLHYGKR